MPTSLPRLACAAAIALAVSPRPSHGKMLTGVSVSGAELNSNALPGKEGTDYIYPDAATLRYFSAHGATCVRVPVLWERLQPVLNGDLAPSELGLLDRTIREAVSDHLRPVVDVHDYGRWRGRVIGQDLPASAFAAFWTALSRHIDGLPSGGTVIYGLMNEPHDMGAAAWRDAEQSVVTAIRQSGAHNLILASGADWDGAHSVVADGNARLLETLHDPDGNMAIELHQYLDTDSSGTKPDCVTPAGTVARLGPATEWLRREHLRGFLGEFGASAEQACLASLDAMLSFLDHNADVWIGWTDWAAGTWWGNYMFSVQPQNWRDAPQMAVLMRHMYGTR